VGINEFFPRCTSSGCSGIPPASRSSGSNEIIVNDAVPIPGQAERVFGGLGIKLGRAGTRRGFGDDEDYVAGLFVVE
jgi:hypothetical protein